MLRRASPRRRFRIVPSTARRIEDFFSRFRIGSDRPHQMPSWLPCLPSAGAQPPGLARSHSSPPTPAIKQPDKAYIARKRNSVKKASDAADEVAVKKVSSLPVKLDTIDVSNGWPEPPPTTPAAAPSSTKSPLEEFTNWMAPAPAAAAPAPAAASSSSDRPPTERGVMTPIVGPLDFGFGILTLEKYDELAMPRLNVKAVNVPITDESMIGVLSGLDTILARGEPLTIMYDLRNAPLPSRKQINIGLDWIAANSHLLDKHLQGIAVIISSFIIRSIVNFVLHLTQPPQPNGCFADEPAAFNFAKEKCTEIKQWVGSKKLKRQKSHGTSNLQGLDNGGSPATSERSGGKKKGKSDKASPRSAAPSPAA